MAMTPTRPDVKGRESEGGGESRIVGLARPAGLSGADSTDFLALRRVCGHWDSRVEKVGEHFVENECPVLPFIADGLVALICVVWSRAMLVCTQVCWVAGSAARGGIGLAEREVPDLDQRGESVREECSRLAADGPPLSLEPGAGTRHRDAASGERSAAHRPVWLSRHCEDRRWVE